MEPRVDRRLAAVLVADLVGYSRLMEADELGTLSAMSERRSDIIAPALAAHGGRLVKEMGDGFLVEFASAVKAVEAALAIQDAMLTANRALDETQRLVLRIGINLGDVIGQGEDIFGEGVNIAARLEGLATPGGLCVSAKVHEEVAGKLDCRFEDMGAVPVKNISRPTELPGAPAPPRIRPPALPRPGRPEPDARCS